MTNTFMVKLASSSLLLLAFGLVLADSKKLPEEREMEIVDFNSIKKVLQQDGLVDSAKSQQNKVSVLKKVNKEVEVDRYMYPSEEELWGFASEYWLVKNAQILSWDFEKPDYGLRVAFKEMLEKLGFYQRRFKILLLNTSSPVRASLPGGPGETIYLLSVPFIRALDLSKLEISLLLMEDHLRMEAGYFKAAVGTDKLKELAGTSFKGKKPDHSVLLVLLSNYDKLINQKGYTFQQQFEVTKKMSAHLRPNPDLWNTYYRLLGKIDRFSKTNFEYKQYITLYPSPEMQLKWLGPEEKNL